MISAEELVDGLDEIFEYIFDDNRGRALSFIDYLKERAEGLIDQPDLGVIYEGKDRRLIIGTHLYSIFYEIYGDTAHILRVVNDAIVI